MRNWLRALFFGAGIGFMAVAFWRALRAGTGTVPPWPALGWAALMTAVSLLTAARGWAAVLAGRAPGPALRAGFIGGQVGKYIPGGVWVGAGQIGLAMEAGVPGACAAGGLVVFGVLLAAAAGTLAGALSLAVVIRSPGAPGWAVLTVPGVFAVVLLHRRRVAALVRALPARLRRRLEGEAPVVPPQAAMVRCFGWLLVSLPCAAMAFVILFRSTGGGDPFLTTVWGFFVAWLAGYLALGLPSGIGAREGALVAVLATGAAPVLTACLFHRLIQIAVEAALVLAARRRACSAAGSPQQSGTARFRTVLPDPLGGDS